jgi:hypothetical protein
MLDDLLPRRAGILLDVAGRPTGASPPLRLATEFSELAMAT